MATWFCACLLLNFCLVASQSILPSNISNSTHYYFIASDLSDNFNNDSIICPVSIYCSIFCDGNNCHKLMIETQESTIIDLKCYDASCSSIELNTANDNSTIINVLCEDSWSCSNAIFSIDNVYSATFIFQRNEAYDVVIYGQEITHSLNIVCNSTNRDPACIDGPIIYPVDPYHDYDIAMQSKINITLNCDSDDVCRDYNGHYMKLVMNQTDSYDIMTDWDNLIISCTNKLNANCGVKFECSYPTTGKRSDIRFIDGILQCDSDQTSSSSCCPVSFMNNYLVDLMNGTNGICENDVNGDCIIHCNELNTTNGCKNLIINATNITARYFKIYCDTAGNSGYGCKNAKIFCPIHFSSYCEIQCTEDFSCYDTEIKYTSTTINNTLNLYCTGPTFACLNTFIDFNNVININYYQQITSGPDRSEFWFNPIKSTNLSKNETHGTITIDCIGTGSCSPQYLNFGFVRSVTFKCNDNLDTSSACSNMMVSAKYAKDVTIYCGAHDCYGISWYFEYADSIYIRSYGNLGIERNNLYVTNVVDFQMHCYYFLSCDDSNIYSQNAQQTAIYCGSSQACLYGINVYANPYKLGGTHVVGSSRSGFRQFQILVPDDYILGYLNWQCLLSSGDCITYSTDFKVSCMGPRNSSYIIQKGQGSNKWYSCSEYPWNPSKCCPWNQTTNSPTLSPTMNPVFPTNSPTSYSSSSPTNAPSFDPSVSPSNAPSFDPSVSPSNVPSLPPTKMPSSMPTATPTDTPSKIPTDAPSKMPTKMRTIVTIIDITKDDNLSSQEGIQPSVMVWVAVLFMLCK